MPNLSTLFRGCQGVEANYFAFFLEAWIAARSMSRLSRCRAVASRVCWSRILANGSPLWSAMQSPASSPARTAACSAVRMSLRLLILSLALNRGSRRSASREVHRKALRSNRTADNRKRRPLVCHCFRNAPIRFAPQFPPVWAWPQLVL